MTHLVYLRFAKVNGQRGYEEGDKNKGKEEEYESEGYKERYERVGCKNEGTGKLLALIGWEPS